MSHEKVFLCLKSSQKVENHFLNRMIMSSTRLKNNPIIIPTSGQQRWKKSQTFVDFAEKVLRQTEQQ